MYISSWFNPFNNTVTAERGSYEYMKMYFAGIAYDAFIDWAERANIGDCIILVNRYSVVKVV
jgi:hypothetical protein